MKKRVVCMLVPLLFLAACDDTKEKEVLEHSSSQSSEKITDTEASTTEENDEMNEEATLPGIEWVGRDGALLRFGEDNTYKYFEKQEDETDNYLEGTFDLYIGEEAVQYIANEMPEYGVTVQEQEELFERSDATQRKDNYYLLILRHEKLMMDGENQYDEIVVVPFYGFYKKSQKKWELANMNSGNYTIFTNID